MSSNRPEDYNENSPNAMFARILLRLDAQDKVLTEIKVQVLKTNGRVTILERLWANFKVRAATVVTVLGAIGGLVGWILDHLLRK